MLDHRVGLARNTGAQGWRSRMIWLDKPDASDSRSKKILCGLFVFRFYDRLSPHTHTHPHPQPENQRVGFSSMTTSWLKTTFFQDIIWPFPPTEGTIPPHFPGVSRRDLALRILHLKSLLVISGVFFLSCYSLSIFATCWEAVMIKS